MKTKATKNDPRWTRPGKMTHEEFLDGIKKAEEGVFYTVEESRQRFEQWLKLREKQ